MQSPETSVPDPIATQCQTLCQRNGCSTATRAMIPTVATPTSASIARGLPRVANANTVNKNRNQNAETEGVKYTKTASTTKSTGSGIPYRVLPVNRSMSASTTAATRYADRKTTDEGRTGPPDVSTRATKDSAAITARASVICRSR
jgi:hypothetical protein